MGRWALVGAMAAWTTVTVYAPPAPLYVIASSVFLTALAIGWALQPIVKDKE